MRHNNLSQGSICISAQNQSGFFGLRALHDKVKDEAKILFAGCQGSSANSQYMHIHLKADLHPR